jgi:hypothetical protein
MTYTAVFVCWLYLLKSLDLNRAFAFVALTFVFVPVVSLFLLTRPGYGRGFAAGR